MHTPRIHYLVMYSARARLAHPSCCTRFASQREPTLTTASLAHPPWACSERRTALNTSLRGIKSIQHYEQYNATCITLIFLLN